MDTTTKVRRPIGRPRRGEDNTRLIDDPAYYNNYYHEKGAMIVKCPRCQRNATWQKLPRHQQTKICMKNRTPENEDAK